MKCLKGVLFIFNLLIWLSGCTVMVIGAWLLMEPSKGHLLNIFAPHAIPTETIYFVAYSLLATGFTILIVSFFGCRVALRESHCILVIYMSLLIILIVTELVTAAVLGIMMYRALSGLEVRLMERMSEYYGYNVSSDVSFTHSLDYAQYKFNCCGIYSDRDYNGTAWWRESHFSGGKRQVPLTCCIFKEAEIKNTGSPMSVVSRVFYKNNEKPWLYPQLKDESACQSQDATVHERFRHKEGCLDKVKNWIQYESLVVILFGVVFASAQAIGIIISAFLCRRIMNMQTG
ncbi:PREDICTED: tetraspanin-11-like [Ceratosolen solmsi marchali]|uniref:Tetraspanin n=1 Tax=Ceratosolen solmsi marchali TaxID=326594 RepID=A0AAJ7DZ29_9HYME|nr:PREDICTED: tetraspanin-11-like [Ceratosolen solmsi marchali]